jgi:two-component SAPR family response regulator
MATLKELTCYIVDDEQHSIDYLIELIDASKGLILAGASTDPVRALKEVANNNGPDLTFLDVDMPEMSGIDFAIAAKSYTTIIFITAMPNHVMALFGTEKFYYLPKPIAYDKFLICLKAVKSGIDV